ncbi:solute carrier family 25 member 44-like [Stylophora pistillata]|uniref:solute carrier family 25 member 44-like n=1 Tax=Stylophora pistillata TaxID=50429 RepID=UPI000C05478A|nr:solute carrier family 25 member 44-like [Stylophora pistillata]
MPEKVEIIEWHQLEKKKYFLFMNVYMLSTNAVLFPVELVKTRLQLQRTKAVYKNTLDVVYKTVKHEGFLGLYKGFPVSQFGVLTGHIYASSYEISREQFSALQNAARGFLAGGLAAALEQTVINPVDVISQRMMVEGQGQRNKQRGTLRSVNIVKRVLRDHGVFGFYRGFAASLMVEGLWSATWWASYCLYLDVIGKMVPGGTSHLVIKGLSGMLAGISSAVVGNPIDVIKVRLQVEGRKSFSRTLHDLLKNEGALALTKGMFASAISEMPCSAITIIGYEMVKKLSLKEDSVI